MAINCSFVVAQIFLVSMQRYVKVPNVCSGMVRDKKLCFGVYRVE